MDPRAAAIGRPPARSPYPARAAVPRAAASRGAPSARPGSTRRATASPRPGKYLAYEDVRPARRGRPSRASGRGSAARLAADVRFDDATVSRRHALVVSQADGVRVLDDRSLNGVYVNGRRVEWSPLTDGDEIVVGRHALFFLDTATVGTAAPATSAGGDRRVSRPRGPYRPRPHGRDDRRPLAQGRDGQDDDRAHARRRVPAPRPGRARRRPRSAGQPVGLLRRAAGRHADGRRRARGEAKAEGGRPRRRHPRDADPRRGRALAVRQDGPRAGAAQGAQGRAQAARRHPHRLPARARPADRSTASSPPTGR